MAEFREAATQHNHIRIKDIDDMREAATEAVLMAIQRCLSFDIAIRCRVRDLLSGQRLSRDAGVVGGKCWS